MEIQHFSHQHPLTFSDNHDRSVCFGCMRSISGPVYGCTECQYFIHKSCGELPLVIQHPFHPPHPLTLLAKAPYNLRIFECHVCKDSCYGFTFHCSECQFDLDTICAMLRPSAHDEQCQVRYLSHRHPLRKVECPGENFRLLLCNWCEMPINGSVYICFECKIFVHKSCTEFPRDNQLQHFSHQHPLTLTHSCGDCSACKDSMSGPAYGCIQCEYFIHKSCSELPQTIQYPFHPSHPLTLLAKAPYPRRVFDCSMCKGRHFAFTYHCSECTSFDVDISCSKIRPSTVHELEDDHDKQHIQHFFHEHPLIAITLPGGIYPFYCSVCSWIIKGLAYVCWQCKFIIHKSCSDLPKVIQHDFHPQHPLTLNTKAPYRSGSFKCYACEENDSGISYYCSQCKVSLDIYCAKLRSFPPSVNQQKHQTQHPCHHHPLFLVTLASGDGIDKLFSCSLCDSYIRRFMYVCFKCKYIIHMSCAEFPTKIQHPFHPQHLLTLLTKPPKRRKSLDCYVCQEACTDTAFYCSKCHFCLHFNCRMFTPCPTTTINSSSSSSSGNKEHEQEIQPLSHPHPLFPITMFEDNKASDLIECSLCREEIRGSAYFCIKCRFFVHKSCADFPHEIINHPFHLAHPLTLLLPPPVPAPKEKLYCSACRKKCPADEFIFQCSVGCLFRMHFKCAMNARTINWEEGKCRDPGIQHFSHPHPLIPVKAPDRQNFTVPWNCSACDEVLETGSTFYVCIQCMFFLGKSCFELPKEVQSPIHPQHPLISNLALGLDKLRLCKVCCDGQSRRLFYHCVETGCKCNVCPTCNNRPIVKYERHEHMLVYMREFSPARTPNNLKCDTCGAICAKCFLRCAECNLNLHVQCIPALPVTGKCRSHRHLLTLTDPLPEDDTNEYYCDACEKERNPKHSVYYCAPCEFAAHIDCAIPKVVFTPDEESSVACQLMDHGISISNLSGSDDDDDDSYDSEEETSEEEGEEDQENDARETVNEEETDLDD